MVEIKNGIFREFALTALRGPDREAVVYKQEKEYTAVTYLELFGKAVAVAGILSQKGLKKGDKVALFLGNEPEWPISFLAAQYIGAVCVPLDTRSDHEEIKRLLTDSGSKLIVLSEKTAREAKPVLAGTEGIGTVTVCRSGLCDRDDAARMAGFVDKMPDIDPDSTAALFYTSGTTGAVKAVMLSGRNLLSNVRSILEMNIFNDKDAVISLLPLHHTFACTATCLLPLLLGAKICYPSGSSAEDMLSCMVSTGVSVIVGVPQLYIMFHKKIREKIGKRRFPERVFIGAAAELLWNLRKMSGINLSKKLFRDVHEPFGKSLRMMISGGAALDPVISKDLLKWGFIFMEGYGLTETSPIVTINPPDSGVPGAAGKPIPDVLVRIDKADEKGSGEILIKGPNVMEGYYKLADETMKVFRDGWFVSGDVGYFDKNGYLHITGRKDEMISLSTGEKVNPERVEEQFNKSPYIRETCVFLSKGSGYFKEANKIVAVVVPDEGYFKSHKHVNIDDRIKWELDHLSHGLKNQERIMGFAISRDRFPRTALGKIKRNEVQKKYALAGSALKSRTEEEAGEEDLRMLSLKICRDALVYLSGKLKREVSLNDHLELDLGVDSLGRIELLLDLEEFMNISVPESILEDVFYSDTIKEIFLKVEPFLPQRPVESRAGEFIWAEVFGKDPAPELTRAVSFTPSFAERSFVVFVLAFIKVLFAVYFRLKVHGRENIPKKGPVILYANHTSFLDGLVVPASLSLAELENMFFLGFRKHYFMPGIVTPGLLKTLHLVTVDAAMNMVNSLHMCAYLLGKNKCITYFPEGQRSPDGGLIEFKKGIGILAKEIRPSFVPVHIKGAFEAWPHYSKYPRPGKIEVTVGKAFTYEELIGDMHGKDPGYAEIAEKLRSVLLGMSLKALK
ncbi:MAG: AMP-binding protein [Candidatus Omnitrophica bacterium]|nr:AMP-binding protein [Candidatus Omnitrophota bacterium]